MFGYLNIDKSQLEQGQQGLWQTFMCGLCLSTKKLFGNTPRMFVNNDVNLFNVLFHSILGADVQIDNQRCVAHPFTKRPIQRPTELSDKLAIGNVILTYLNLYDDVVDGGNAKKSALRLYRKTYRKAQKLWPELDQALQQHCAQLRQLEQGGCNSLDQVAHSFASLSEDFCKMVLGEASQEFAQTLCYNLGKWVYLIDALDDLRKDLKRHNYNPFVACYNATTLQEVAAHKDEITFLMYAVLNRIATCYNDLNLQKYHCILHNVLHVSIRSKTQQVLAKLWPVQPTEN